MISPAITGRRLVAVGRQRVEFLGDEPLREPGEGQIALRMQRTLISPGTELAKVAGLTGARAGDDWRSDPLPLGHSAGAVVTGIGPGVDRFAVNDRVSAWAPHATNAIISADRAAVLPSNVSFEEATFGTLLALALHIVHLSQLQLNQCCAVVGFGLIGQLTANAAKIAGARRIVVFEHRQSRRELARELGYIADPSSDGFEIVYETAGSTSALNDALRVAASSARVIVAGSMRESIEIDVYRHVHLKGLTLIGAHGVTQKVVAGGNRWSELENRAAALDYIADGRAKVERLISHRLAARDGVQGLDLLGQKAGNAVILDWSDE